MPKKMPKIQKKCLKYKKMPKKMPKIQKNA